MYNERAVVISDYVLNEEDVVVPVDFPSPNIENSIYDVRSRFNMLCKEKLSYNCQWQKRYRNHILVEYILKKYKKLIWNIDILFIELEKLIKNGYKIEYSYNLNEKLSLSRVIQLARLDWRCK